MFYSCIITRNRGASSLIGGGVNSFAHCSIFGNNTYTAVAAGSGGVASNNVVALSHSSSTGTDVSGTTVGGNITGTANGIYQFIAPAIGDFRILAGSAADLSRIPGADGSSLYRPIPEEYRSLDFYGNPIPAVNALPGAVQDVVAAAGGALQFEGLSSTEGVIVNQWKSIKPGAYLFPTNYPQLYHVTPALSSGKI